MTVRARTAYRMLLSPITINQVTRSRTESSTAHATAYAIDGHPKEKYRRYYQRKARGGVGLIYLWLRVGPSEFECRRVERSRGLGRRHHSRLAAMADVVHRHGAKIFCQLTHMGRRGTSINSSRPLFAPSPLSEPAHRERSKQMEIEEIRDVVLPGRMPRIVSSAAATMVSRLRLTADICSNSSGRRTSTSAPTICAGSLEKRMRLSVEVIEAVRDRVGSDFVVGFRMTGDQLLKGGLGHDEMKVIAARLGELHKLDYFNISGLTGETAEPKRKPSHRSTTRSVFSTSTRRRSAVVDVPLVAARIVEPSMAEAALQRGRRRSHRNDQILDCRSRSTEESNDRRTRRNQALHRRERGCIGRLFQGLPIRCVQNPLIGHEDEFDTLESAGEIKKVVVVGGGPGGMEAARIAAERGHQVVLRTDRKTSADKSGPRPCAQPG